MIKGKKILGIIPARGGSKGIPKKNIKSLLGIPLIAWTIKEAQKSKYIDKLILSSEDKEIISIAKKYGLEVPFLRPKELSRDDTIPIEVTLHALKQCPGFDLIVVLQPTCPLRIVEHIDSTIQKLIDLDAPACVSVSLQNKSPYWMYKIDSKERLVTLFPNEETHANRQDLPIVYALNGSVYVADINWLKKKKSFISEQTIAYEMPPEMSVDIDDEFDFKIAELIARQGLI